MRVTQLIEVILMPRERTVDIVDFHSKFFDLEILGITKLIFFRKLLFQCAHLSCQENLLASQCCIVFLEFFQLLLTLSVLLPFRLSQLCLQRANLIVFCLELILLLLKLNLESITFLFKLIDFLRQALPFGPILLHFFAICAHYCSSRLWRPTSAKLFLSLILRQIILLLRLCLTTFPRSVEILFLLELLLHFHDIGCHRFELSFIYIQYLLCLGSTFHNCSELIIKCASQRCNSALVVLILAICLFLLNDLHRSSMAVVESFFNSLHLCLQQTLQRLQWD